MKNLKYVGLCLVFMLLVACSALPATTSNVIKENTWFPIGKILNNDSFEIVLGDHIEQVTFLSLDVTDINDEVFGMEIHQYISDQLLASQQVMLSFDKEMRKENGQLQAIVQLQNGTILNEKLLELGYAKLLIVEPNIKMENVYKQIEQQAKGNHTGVWINTEETSNEDVTLKETRYTGISLSINKREQEAIISNHTSTEIDLSHWKLLSVTGNQTYIFEEFILEPGKKITIYATEKKESKDLYSYYWGSENVWDVTQKESAELYNTKNELIADWEE
ncbi:MAG: lamin tail domain-containing protein [Candidatus Pristimantibacillus lignocellulolyticus]|uniref:Lamin tail domain-containing protein n=1 Tax=Candidatus Pristimantibacillus lignocellulolyticus TaxID=2994561 RepID=A0A9J6ZAZ6_9BACL|nr:MAG: lamin tail domain-containing protein [Candidatus Pristimantibacillus lignocellulolyticus]